MDKQKVIDLIISTLSGHLAGPARFGAAKSAVEEGLPSGQLANIEAVLASSSISYRDGLIIQLAYALCAEGHLDLTQRHPGARGMSGVAGKLGAFLAESHIISVRDAYQNIGKNTANLVRGNFDEFDAFLKWATEPERTKEEFRAAFDYACAAVASTSRPVRAMPELNVGALTFANVMGLLDEMFDAGSQGAYEQFAIAALLHASVAQAGPEGHRVETKSLNASDRGSRVAGDIQVLTGTRVVEAYEVTANEWATKVDSAERTIRDNDLSRLHIVAASSAGGRPEMLQRLHELGVDVSVLDLREFASSLVSGLTRQGRAVALGRLYEFLDRYQPDVERVNRYVEMLGERGLTQGS